MIRIDEENKKIIAVILIIIGFFLFVDEIFHFYWICGALPIVCAALHLEPFHHWMLGLVLVVIAVLILTFTKEE